MKLTVKVLKIYDGDTVLISHGSFVSKVRFSLIDSPEKKQPFLKEGGDAGKVSTACLKRLLTDEIHELKIYKQDIYGRILGDIDDISFRSIKEGCATIYPHATFESQKDLFRYLKALKKAKAAKRGLWNKSGFLQPKKWRRISKRVSRRQ